MATTQNRKPTTLQKEGYKLIEQVGEAFQWLDHCRAVLTLMTPGHPLLEGAMFDVSTAARNLAELVEKSILHRRKLQAEDAKSRETVAA